MSHTFAAARTHQPRSSLVAYALLAVAVAVAVAVVGGGSGCRRACENADNCKRTCDCENSVTGAVTECTMAFNCDRAEGYCEADFDGLSCNQICGLYVDGGKCGFARCATNDDCLENLTCPILNQDGTPSGLSFDCTIPFTCGNADKLCEPGSELPDAQQCALPVCQAQRPQP